MEEEKRKIEQQKRLEEELKRRADLRRKYLEEEARVDQLIAEAENWKKSQILRDYIVEIESSATAGNLSFSTEKPFNEWLKWAKSQADRLDPLKQSPPSILDEESREKIKMIHMLAKHGAKWLPNDHSEIGDARRSLLKMKPDYTVEFIWIMSKYNATTRGNIEELIRTPSIRSVVHQHMVRINELLKNF